MPERRGLALGFYLAAASLGYAIGLLIASAMIPLAGWRGGFIVTALFPLLGLGLGWWALRDVPNVVHALPDGHGTRSRIGEVLRNKPAMLSIWGYTFHAWELLGLWAWLPAFLAAAVDRRWRRGPAQAVSLGATLSALTYLVAVVGSVMGGSLVGSPRTHRRHAGHGPVQPGLLLQLSAG
jgi:MFS family permease